VDRDSTKSGKSLVFFFHAKNIISHATRFVGRYNTMVVFLFRPSPQVPRPSLQAAIHCYDACEFNIHMTRKQIETKSVDITWIFTQAIFMAINTMLWTLSYSEIRRLHHRDEVEQHLQVALESIDLSSERWPGVSSALQLYRNLIHACMKIFEKDGDIPISAGSPSDTASVVSSMVEGINRSRTTSPASVSTGPSITTPSEKTHPPFGYLPNQSQQPLFGFTTTQQNTPSIFSSSPIQPSSLHTSPQQGHPYLDTNTKSSIETQMPTFNYPPTTQFAPLPTTFAELPQWSPTFTMPPHNDSFSMPISSPIYNENYAANQGYPMADYLYPQWSADASRGMGLNHEQQMELMQSFEANETSRIQAMIQQSNQIWRPHMQHSY